MLTHAIAAQALKPISRWDPKLHKVGGRVQLIQLPN